MRHDKDMARYTVPAVQWSWVDSIDEILPGDWDRCFAGGGVLQSYALQQATEHAGIESTRYHYLIGRFNGRVEALLPCFEFRISLTVIAPSVVQKAVSFVRKGFRNFLYLHAFIAGTPIAICRDLFGLRGGAYQLLGRAGELIVERARGCDAGMVILKEITAPLLKEAAPHLPDQFTIVESPATTYLCLGTGEQSDYRSSLRYKYRSVMKARVRRFQQSGMRWEKVDNFEPYAEELHALYLQVLKRSKIRFESLTVDFFRRVSLCMKGSVFAMLCFKGDQVVAFELFMHDRKALYPLYLGLDYACRDEGSLYFSCIYKIIELAEERNLEYVELGQTSYATKAGLGAVVSPLYLAVSHNNPLVCWLLQKFQSVLFPATPVPRCQRTFRDIDAVSARLSELGVPFVLGERSHD